jgi:hypothetical protein
MGKNRIYNERQRVVGTLHTTGIIGLQLGLTSKLRVDFLEVINNFLKKNKLKPVSDIASFRKHYNHNDYNINMKGIDIYYKSRNPRTQKIEIKSIMEQK